MELNPKTTDITCGGVSLPSPETFSISYSDKEQDSGDDVLTQKHYKNVSRYNIRKISLSYAYNSDEETKTILQAVSGKNSFTIKHWDPLTGGMYTGSYYTSSDRTVDTILLTDDGHYIKGLKIELTEC